MSIADFAEWPHVHCKYIIIMRLKTVPASKDVIGEHIHSELQLLLLHTNPRPEAHKLRDTITWQPPSGLEPSLQPLCAARATFSRLLIWLSLHKEQRKYVWQLGPWRWQEGTQSDGSHTCQHACTAHTRCRRVTQQSTTGNTSHTADLTRLEGGFH